MLYGNLKRFGGTRAAVMALYHNTRCDTHRTACACCRVVCFCYYCKQNYLVLLYFNLMLYLNSRMCLLRFRAVRCRSISPFDAEELPNSLSICKTPKKKEALKTDAQEAIEASSLTRRVPTAVAIFSGTPTPGRNMIIPRCLVVFTLNRSFYPTTSSAVPPVSFLILHPREAQIMWSQ